MSLSPFMEEKLYWTNRQSRQIKKKFKATISDAATICENSNQEKLESKISKKRKKKSAVKMNLK